MRILIFLILSCFLFSQPTKNDSIDIPPVVKPNVEEIISDAAEVEKASEELNKEITKQLNLMKQIKSKIYKIKSNPIAKKITKDEIKDTFVTPEAIKIKPIYIEVDGQIVQWELRNRSWFGRIFHTENIIYYPFIVDKDGNKVYLK